LYSFVVKKLVKTLFLHFYNQNTFAINIIIQMGVPVFFKWLSTRNPKLVKDAIEPENDAYTLTGNPSIDNFYIDMNGLIHPSCNPKGENIRIPANF